MHFFGTVNLIVGSRSRYEMCVSCYVLSGGRRCQQSNKQWQIRLRRKNLFDPHKRYVHLWCRCGQTIIAFVLQQDDSARIGYGKVDPADSNFRISERLPELCSRLHSEFFRNLCVRPKPLSLKALGHLLAVLVNDRRHDVTR